VTAQSVPGQRGELASRPASGDDCGRLARHFHEGRGGERASSASAATRLLGCALEFHPRKAEAVVNGRLGVVVVGAHGIDAACPRLPLRDDVARLPSGDASAGASA
jgi:hypothetical protein